jgi:hypothetical protein
MEWIEANDKYPITSTDEDTLILAYEVLNEASNE